jgi:hypothetical protein
MDHLSTNQPVAQFSLGLAEMVRAKPDVIVTFGAEAQILRTYVDVGGLMSYGVDIGVSFRRLAHFVARF